MKTAVQKGGREDHTARHAFWNGAYSMLILYGVPRSLTNTWPLKAAANLIRESSLPKLMNAREVTVFLSDACAKGWMAPRVKLYGTRSPILQSVTTHRSVFHRFL